MKKNNKKQLSLSTQTLRNLQADGALIKQVVGGLWSATNTMGSACCEVLTMVETQCWGHCGH